MRNETRVWLAIADEAWAAARVLLEAELRRSCVLHVHLTVEKTLKALVAEVTGRMPPLTHRLRDFADLAALSLDDEMKEFLVTLSPRSVTARYDMTPEPFTRDFCIQLMRDTDEEIRWLRQHVM